MALVAISLAAIPACSDGGAKDRGSSATPDGGSNPDAAADAGGEPDATGKPDGSKPPPPPPDGGIDAAPPSDGGAKDGAAPPDAADDAAPRNDGGRPDGGDAGPPEPTWFEPGAPLELSISGALGDAFRAAFAGTPDGIVPPKRLKDPFPGTAGYAFLDGTDHTVDMELAVRGNSSLQECPFPKLKVTFDARVTDPNDAFAGTRKFKIGTHCGEEDTVNGTIGRLRNEKATFREELVYQLARASGITIMETRPAIVTYTDTSGDAGFASPLTRKAFLLEHVDELARRLGATALKDPVDCGPDTSARPDPEAVLRVKFFHAMIANWDWGMGPPETGGCGNLWNTEVLVNTDGTLTLVPTDFDLSGFVVGEVRDPDTNQFVAINATNARISARGYLTTFLAGEPTEAIDAMKAEYLAKRAGLEAVLAASLVTDQSDPSGAAAGRLLLAGFFEALAE